MMSQNKIATTLGLLATLLLAGCERPPVEMVQTGFRGTGMAQVYNPRTLSTMAELNRVPEPLAPAESSGPRAKDIYQNVQVLGDLSVQEFTRHMLAITQWVAPKDGCTYCHNPANLADDSKYTKVVARRMIQMTQHINSEWETHVADTGVTCYTCHRGNPQPQDQNGKQAYWYSAATPKRDTAGMLGWRNGQNEAAYSVAMASLPKDPFTPFLLRDENIRVQSGAALPQGDNAQTTKSAEWTYGLMNHMSKSLGVSCTYCHNSRAFASWEESSPQRVKAWHGIRMVRDLNNQFLEPLGPVYDADDLGPTGDAPKAFCATCHKGAYKPLYGQSQLKDYPELKAPLGSAKTAAAGD